MRSTAAAATDPPRGRQASTHVMGRSGRSAVGGRALPAWAAGKSGGTRPQRAAAAGAGRPGHRPPSGGGAWLSQLTCSCFRSLLLGKMRELQFQSSKRDSS